MRNNPQAKTMKTTMNIDEALELLREDKNPQRVDVTDRVMKAIAPKPLQKAEPHWWERRTAWYSAAACLVAIAIPISYHAIQSPDEQQINTMLATVYEYGENYGEETEPMYAEMDVAYYFYD